ncbi:unnamed protein product [Bursaphelenchus xylophilus]|uniref:(pine wood nematode) hypothetical protein n=1 Tax=Bursaphelenchus xylophilus TaxID=6326 RepID=A0A1I7RIC5_BURXY|nr:unnamed protein product [Bursaphelenchus xylophilus]CAG9114989.1 unnamed protein product [Bursaphelenchus xylophilus]
MKAVVIICLLVVCVSVLEACSPKPSTKKSSKNKNKKKTTKKGSKKTTKATTTTAASRKRRETSPIVVTLYSTTSIDELDDLLEDLDNLIDGYDINKELILTPKPDIRIDEEDQVVLEYKVDPEVDCGDIQMAIERIKEELDDVSQVHVKCKDLELSF